MQVLVFVVLAAGIIGLIIWGALQHQKKVRANLAALATRLGLQLTGDPRGLTSASAVSGLRQGKEVRFWTYATGSGKSRRTWCAVGVRPRAHGGLQFELRRQGFGTKVMEWFGAKEIKVGDPDFDRAWFIRTNQPEFLAAALVPEIRAKLTALDHFSSEKPFRLEGGLVQFSTPGTFGSDKVVARLEAGLPMLYDLADLAEVYAAGDSR
jgi:hypothetical protein